MGNDPWKVFLDTSVIIAGLFSPTGGAHEILRLCETQVISGFISRQVVIEGDRNLTAKLPAALPLFHELLRSLALHILDDPPAAAVQEAARWIHFKDAPILAAAQLAQVDWVITHDVRHFKVKTVQALPLKIGTPGEFLDAFRQWVEERGS
jgi:predicted nucleic acid-binding protein